MLHKQKKLLLKLLKKLQLKKLQLNPEVSTVYFRTPLAEEEEMSLYRYFKSVERL